MNRRQFVGFGSAFICGIAGCVNSSVEDSPSGSSPVDESSGNTANPVTVLIGIPAENGTEYKVKASVQTNGADSLVIMNNEEEFVALKDGKEQIIASSSPSTADPLSEESLLVTYGVWGNQRNEIFRWRVKEEEVGNVDGWDPFKSTQASS